VQWSPRAPRDDVNVSRTHPLSEAASLVLGIGFALFALVAVAWGTLEIAARWLPYDVESKLFGGLRPAVGGESHDTRPHDDAEARRVAVQALLDRLSSHWPERPYALRVEIVGAREPNAAAFPGGAVLVTDGLLRQVRSENELSFVLAHEVGHFRNRDHLRRLGRSTLVGLALAAIGFGDASAAATSQPFLLLAGRGFDRAEESDADRFALELVVAEYGHGAGAADFFRGLPDAEAGLGVRVAGWVSTHPVSEARIEALEAFARERGFAMQGSLAPLPEALAHDRAEP
jgi:predicted Zn-dependent protease